VTKETPANIMTRQEYCIVRVRYTIRSAQLIELKTARSLYTHYTY